MLHTPEQAAPQPSTRSLIEQGEPRGLRLLRIVLPLAVNRHRTVTLRDFGLPFRSGVSNHRSAGVPIRADRDPALRANKRGQSASLDVDHRPRSALELPICMSREEQKQFLIAAR